MKRQTVVLALVIWSVSSVALEISGVSQEAVGPIAWEYYDVANEQYSLTSMKRDGRLMTVKRGLSWQAAAP